MKTEELKKLSLGMLSDQEMRDFVASKRNRQYSVVARNNDIANRSEEYNYNFAPQIKREEERQKKLDKQNDINNLIAYNNTALQIDALTDESKKITDEIKRGDNRLASAIEQSETSNLHGQQNTRDKLDTTIRDSIREAVNNMQNEKSPAMTGDTSTDQRKFESSVQNWERKITEGKQFGGVPPKPVVKEIARMHGITVQSGETVRDIIENIRMAFGVSQSQPTLDTTPKSKTSARATHRPMTPQIAKSPDQEIQDEDENDDEQIKFDAPIKHPIQKADGLKLSISAQRKKALGMGLLDTPNSFKEARGTPNYTEWISELQKEKMIDNASLKAGNRFNVKKQSKERATGNMTVPKIMKLLKDELASYRFTPSKSRVSKIVALMGTLQDMGFITNEDMQEKLHEYGITAY